MRQGGTENSIHYTRGCSGGHFDERDLRLVARPGEIIKAHVDSIVWAQGQGQVQISGVVPQTGVQAQPAERFIVKLSIDPRHRDEFLAAGASGQAAIYTDHVAAIHIIRKVMLRVGSYTNYIIPKLH